MSYRKSPSSIMSDYAHLRTVPAFIGIIFAIASLYQFGGISEVTVPWLSYSLTASHAMMVSLGAMVIAFVSSDTKAFGAYQDWEKVLIALGPVLIIGEQYVTFVGDMVANNQPIAGVVAFVICLSAWGVLVR